MSSFPCRSTPVLLAKLVSDRAEKNKNGNARIFNVRSTKERKETLTEQERKRRDLSPHGD
jgi:hypothetical protein